MRSFPLDWKLIDMKLSFDSVRAARFCHATWGRAGARIPGLVDNIMELVLTILCDETV